MGDVESNADPVANPALDPVANPALDPVANPALDPVANPALDPVANPALDPAADPGPYPAHWEADVLLRDGATAHLRPITPEDAESLRRFHASQSAESTYLRFFAAMPQLSEADAFRFTNVDHRDRVAFVCTLGDEIVGVGRYDRVNPATAEVAFNIGDAHQQRGLSSVLLEHLAAAARENGVRRFVAEVLPQNRKMLTVFRQAGYEVRQHVEDGVVTLSFDIHPTERSLAVMEAREHRAEARSMQILLTPASVAVIGASRRPATVGHRLLADLLAGDFAGRLHVIHREAEAVLGVPALPSIAAVGEPVDLAVIAVPAEAVLQVVAECAAARVRSLVVLSSGFAETGPEGLARQRELVRLARANGLRVVGPNSWGLINANPAVRLNVSLLESLPSHGRFGLFSESGGMSVSVLDAVARRGIGLSTFVSAGNRADVSGNDCLQFWEEDPGTDVIGLYLESLGNPRKFSRIARRLARTKPVIVVMPGVSEREAFAAMFQQSGCIRVQTARQLLDVARVLLHQPLPAGRRVAVVSNSDALASMTADACASWQLEVTHGPVALPPQAGLEEFSTALSSAFCDPDVDAVTALFIPPMATAAEEIARVLEEAAAASQIPVVACLLGMTGAGSGIRPREVIPTFGTPEEAVQSLAAAVTYAQWRRRDPGRPVEPPEMDLMAARAAARDVLATSASVQLDPEAAARLIAFAGVQVWPAVPVADADEAVDAAERLGFPVALKASAPQFRHRLDLGGVRLDIENPAELRADVEHLRARLGPLGHQGLLVQRMAPSGVPCVVRAVEDPLLGPVVSFGLAGDAMELLGDVAHRIPPLTEVDVADLVRSVRAAPKLFGHRGADPVDVPALEELIARVACLADDVPEIAELELNPVIVSTVGAHVLGATVRLAPPAPSESARRALSTS